MQTEKIFYAGKEIMMNNSDSCRGDLEIFKEVKILITDVDGVLTSGYMFLNDKGGETGAFSVKDHTGIKYLLRAGIHVVFLCGRDFPQAKHFAKTCGVDVVITKAKTKAPLFKELLKRENLKPEQACYIGDDLPDLSCMNLAGVSVSPLDGHEIVKRTARFISTKKGGSGVIREVAELILEARGLWEDILERYQR